MRIIVKIRYYLLLTMILLPLNAAAVDVHLYQPGATEPEHISQSQPNNKSVYRSSNRTIYNSNYGSMYGGYYIMSKRNSSSAVVHSYGGSISSTSAGNYQNTTLKNNIGSSSISMIPIPTLTTNRNNKSSTSDIAESSSITRRNIYIPNVSETDDEGNYWDVEKEEWLPIPDEQHAVGDRKYDKETGKWFEWNGETWIEIEEVDLPIGDVPWLLMILMVVYCLRKRNKRKLIQLV